MQFILGMITALLLLLFSSIISGVIVVGFLIYNKKRKNEKGPIINEEDKQNIQSGINEN